MAGILIQAAFISAIVLLALRRWGPRLPYGTFAVIFAINGSMVAASRDQLSLVPGVVLAGLVADTLVRRLAPSVERAGRLRAVAFAIPATYFALYFLGIAMTRGVWWSTPLWSGTIVMSGAVGWLASWLVVPPAIPGEPAGDAARNADAARRHSMSY